MADEPQTPSFLRRKLFGRVPVLYVLAAGVVVLAVVAWRMKASSDATPDDTSGATDEPSDTSTIDPIATGDVSGVTNTGGFVANPQPAIVTNDDGTTGNATIADNQTWLRKSVEWLVANGQNAGYAQQALQAYLNGEQLSYGQGQLRDRAVKQFGLPPEQFNVGGTLGKPADPAKKQGPLPRTHVVKGPNDNTYAKLAQLYYGNGDSAHVNLIKAENTPQATWGNSNGPFPVGSGVRIPAYIAPVYYRSTKKINTLAEIASKNGRSQNDIQVLNPGMKFPVKSGTRVRVK